MGTFIRGGGLQKSNFTTDGFPCIHYGQIHTFYKTYAYETISYTSNKLAAKLKHAKYGDLIIATTSEDVDGCCKAVAWLGDNEVAISGDSYIFSTIRIRNTFHIYSKQKCFLNIRGWQLLAQK